MPFSINAAPGGSTPSTIPVNIQASCSDLSSAIVAGTGKAYLPPPYGYNITQVGFFLVTPQTSGATFTVDILKNGVSILSTKITITNGDNYSWDAVSQPVISDSAVLIDDILRVDVTVIGDGTAKGLIIIINGERT